MKYQQVKISGKDLGSEGIIQLINKIQKAAKKSVNIALNFKGVEIINSGGIGVLIRSHKDLQIEKGGLAIIEVSEQMQVLCENSGLNRIIPIYKNIEDYEAVLEKSAPAGT